jgi:hypothetical protein
MLYNQLKIELSMPQNNLTVSQKELEIQRCIADPIYFMEHYCYVVTDINNIAGSRRSLIKLFDFQKKFIECCNSATRVIVLKPRQVGMSTVTVLYLLHHCIFTTDAQVVVVSINETEAQKFLYKANVAFHELPEWLVGKIKIESASKLQFASDSFLEVRSASERAGRGLTCTKFVMDEAAFIDKKTRLKSADDDLASKIWTGAKPSLGASNQAIILSTPQGSAGFYYETWHQAIRGTQYQGEFWKNNAPLENGENGFVPFTLEWRDFPSFDDAWYQKQLIEYKGRERALSQEVLRSFLGSGDLVIKAAAIEKIEKEEVQEPVQVLDGLRVFKQPSIGSNYFLGVDTATAKGSDFSTIEVFDRNSMEQVAEYQAKVSTTVFGKKVYDVAKMYNNGVIICETNGIGQATLDTVIQLSYNNIFKIKDKEGIHCNNEINENRVGSFKEMLESGIIKIHSKYLLDELKTFIWSGNIGEAQGNSHDDLVSACTLVSYAASKVNENPYDALQYLTTAGSLINNESGWSVYLKKINEHNDSTAMTPERREKLKQRVIMDLGVSNDYLESYDMLINNKW